MLSSSVDTATLCRKAWSVHGYGLTNSRGGYRADQIACGHGRHSARADRPASVDFLRANRVAISGGHANRRAAARLAAPGADASADAARAATAAADRRYADTRPCQFRRDVKS